MGASRAGLNKKVVGLLAISLLVAILVPGSRAYAAGNSTVPDDVTLTSGKYLLFGNYPQSSISQAEITSQNLVKNVDYVEYGSGTFYKIEPLLWRIFETPANSESVMLVTSDIVDKMPYSATDDENSALWAPSLLREWLCGTGKNTVGGKMDFLNEAYFEPALYNAIVPQATDSGTLPLGSSVFAGASETTPTPDQTVLSRAQVLDSSRYPTPSPADAAYVSAYAKALNGGTDSDPQIWTKTPDSAGVLVVLEPDPSGDWTNVTLDATDPAGVRPSITLNFERVAFATENNGGTKGSGTASDPYVLEPRPTPHGGYSTTSSKCASCHAGTVEFETSDGSISKKSFHAVEGNGENNFLISTYSGKYLNDPSVDSCIYCHIDTTVKDATVKVYDGSVENYQVGDPSKQPASTHYGHNYNDPQAKTGVACIDCHVVHGTATTKNAYLDHMLLKAPDGTFDPAGPAAYANATQSANWSTEPGETAVSTWCIGCHSAPHGTGTELNSTLSSSSHKSLLCQDCHGTGYGTADWPHYVDGVDRFLLSGNSASSEAVGAVDGLQDGVCLRCHRTSDTSDITP